MGARVLALFHRKAETKDSMQSMRSIALELELKQELELHGHGD